VNFVTPSADRFDDPRDVSAEHQGKCRRRGVLPDAARDRPIHGAHARGADPDQHLTAPRARLGKFSEGWSGSVRVDGDRLHLRPPGKATLLRIARTCGDVGHAKRRHATLHFDRGDADAVRREAPCDLDGLRVAPRFDTQRGRGQRHYNTLHEGLADAAEGLDAVAHEQMPDWFADLNPHGPVAVRDDPAELARFERAVVHVETAGARAERLNRASTRRSINAPKFTNPMPLGPKEVTGAFAIHRSTLPQLSSTMSFGPYVVTGPRLRTVFARQAWTTKTPPLI